ncbi:MAG: TerB family tellurite resistance protein [Deltaproteobacteria bacterium]|nr:TerB family tellurite resistance protein [Deltaproteobacteria bacterium]
MLEELSRAERMRLMKFVCSFAWADLEVQDEERAFVAKLVDRLGLNAGERKQVRKWLEVPPRPEEVDPSRIPRQHRELFLKTVHAVVAADQMLAPDEREMLDLFEQLLQ